MIHKLNKTFLLFLLMMVMGVGSAWGQDPEPTKSVWDGNVPSTAGVSKAECNKIGITGSGTEAEPYVISTAGQFAYFASKMSNDAKWWKLAENIELDLDGENHPWTYGQSNVTFKGHFDGNGSTISNMKFEVNVASKNFGLFPQLTGSSATNHAEIKNLTLKNCQITTPGSSSSYTKTTLTGLLVGKAGGNTDIENVTVSGSSIAYDVTTTDANYVGVLVGSLNSDNNTVKGCTVNSSMENSVETPTTITAGTAQKKNFYAGGLVGYAENNSLVTGNTVTASITLDGATSGNNYIGGLVGYVKGSNSTVSNELPMGKRSIVKSNTVTPTMTMNGEVATATFSMGGVIGWTDSHVNVLNNKVTPTISITNNVNNTAYVGGAIGYMAGYTYADGMTVNGGSISSNKTTDKTVKNNITFFVGGFLGYQVSSGVNAFQANKFKNIAVTGININLGHYVPGGTINNHKFAVGGIAGSVNAPNLDATNNWDGMPENIIFKGGKIYAPYAATSPTVANFNASNATYNNYTGENISSVDELIKSKRNTWYYSDYELGLAKDIMANTNAYNAAPTNGKVRRNFSKTTTADKDDSNLEWLKVDGSTFLRKNRYLDNDRESWTVLWWTRQEGSDSYANNDIEQAIFPKSDNTGYSPFNTSAYNYYMYFYQGVANAKYASATDAKAIIDGIAANMTEAAKATPVTLSITNDKENERGFDKRTIIVAASDGGNYTYQWYLNGKANTTGSSINLTPHWKDGQGLTVNALNGSTIVATATYTLAPGVMKTKAGDTEKVRSVYTGRGTSNNPYIIDCENALRQLSYLSTAHNALLWEGIVKPGVDPKNQSQGHYNRAYYELGTDITMSKDPFVPISHMGTNNSGSDGTYSQNYIFQGSFDGKGHKISNLNITWGAGQYNGNDAHVYHGLFGAIGNTTATAKWGDGSTTSPTVIKNLVISNATLTHDTNNTSFYYNNGNSGNSNNCYVGVLAGIVGANTTIQNIEIRNSQITDDESADYNLATRGLFVGGAIGSVQKTFNGTDNVPANTSINHIAADVDITLKKPYFNSATTHSQIKQFNIGGIIGRYCATSATYDEIKEVMPKYTFYSGSITAPNAWISPVLGTVRYKDQQKLDDWSTFSKQWEGNNNAAGTQLTITNAQYYNFRIGGTLITELYPDNRCGNNARSIASHTDGTDAANTYDAKKYQGVNYGARYIDSDKTTLYFMNQEPTEDIYWVWDNGFPHMTDQQPTEAYLDRVVNNFTAQMTEGTGSAYRWQISFDGDSWTDIDGADLQTYIVSPSSKTKIIVAYVTSGGTEYRTQVEAIWAGENPFDAYIDKTGDSSIGYTFNVVWKDGTEPSGPLTPNYQWYKSDQKTAFDGQTSTSLTLSQGELDAAGGYVWCAINVQEFGSTVYKWMLVAGDLNVVYVNGNGYTGSDSNGPYGAGNDSNNGMTPQTPVKTIDKANSLLDGGPWDKNIIVVMGTLNTAEFRSKGTNPATLTGKWEGIDYEGVITIGKTSGEDVLNKANQSGQDGLHNYVKSDTRFENLTFRCAAYSADNNFIECHGNDVWFGKGLVMTNFRNLSKGHGNLEVAQNIPELTIVLTATNLNEADLQKYIRTDLRTGNNRSKPQTLTIESGHYGRIMGGRFTNKFFSLGDNTSHTILGSTRYPLWAIVNIDIDKDNPNKGTIERGEDPNKGTVTDNFTLDINCIIAGLTDGTMYGDYTINVHGGKIGYIVGGNQGNPVPNISNSFPAFLQPGGKLGNWGQWPNSTYLGRTIINVEQDRNLKDITIDNLYAGGLGREANGSNATSIVDMYMYGHTEINMKSGTITGNVYGGGAGGVIGLNPWDMHVPYATNDADNATNAVMNGVQYGEWGPKKAGSPLANVTLHDSDDNGGYITNQLNLSESYTTLNISGGTINGSVYGGGCGYVSNMPKEVVMQGVGSVFGTSNVNISGGTIHGSVYGGSEGSDKYYGAENKYFQTINHIAEMNGTVNLTVTGTESQYPTIGGSVYGAGMGIVSKSATEEYLRIATAGNYDLAGPGATEEQKSKYKTDINITIDMPETVEFPNDIYGGGALGKVDGTTSIALKRGMFTGSIYGGGYGELQHLDKAMVTGTTKIYTGSIDPSDVNREHPVSIEPIDTRIPTIYGGGNMAQVTGNTYINLWHGNITANVFGGGKGLTQSQSGSFTDYGKVTGNTRVLYNNTTKDNKLTGNIYGGGALGAVVGTGTGQDKGTTVVIKAGEVDGDVFGGGKGEEGSEKAKVTGNTNVIVDSEWTEPTPEP